jgi:nucleotide-binding universal stress UspA family protein
MVYRHILASTDFSPLANQALHYAFEEAMQHHARLTLLHVVSHHPTTEVYYVSGRPGPQQGYGSDSFGGTLPVPPSVPAATILRDYGEEALMQLRELVPPTFTETWEPRIATGDPAEAILHLAQELTVDLIVMATHGRTGLPHVLLGSVAEKVVRRAPCAVLVTRGNTTPAA